MTHPLPLPIDLLREMVQYTFGSQAEVLRWSILTGGARKKVLRLDLDHPRQPIILLVWQNAHDYFGERDNSLSVRSDRQAPLLYRASTEMLLQNDVRVPSIYHFDCSYRYAPFGFALVEYLQARTFNEWKTGRTSKEIQALFHRIRDYLWKMHSIQRDTYGTLLDPVHKSALCHQQTLEEALSNLSDLARNFEVVAKNDELIKKELEKLYRAIPPRARYSFIHDELGPDEHLLIDHQDNIAIIDVDGCQFYDLEREYAYLKLRFSDYYPWLERDDLEAARMAFYGLCLHISAAYGHYQLYRQGFPDPEMLKTIYEWNIQKIVSFTTREDMH